MDVTRNDGTAGELNPSDRRTPEVRADAPADPWDAFWLHLAELFEAQAGGQS
ncbi:hypothetical protein ACIQM3_16880 [Streptomyces sp. NPDC091271]|uniref:hypothetical protein n=1 Tax=Streptomyces sp. NPDC091271 TaxID=3365980 RepID=UPI0038028CDF